MMEARHTRRLIANILAGIGLVLALAIEPALAQTGATTGLSGRVADPTGGALSGATVTVESADTGAACTVTTNETGDWQVRFSAPRLLCPHIRVQGVQDAAARRRHCSTAEMRP